MPLDSGAISDLKSRLQKLGDKELNFAFGIARQPQDSVMLTDRSKAGRGMFDAAKAEAGGKEGVHGVLRVADGVLRVTCLRTPPAGLAKKMRAFLTKALKLRWKVEILDENGALVDADLTDAPDGESGGESGGETGAATGETPAPLRPAAPPSPEANARHGDPNAAPQNQTQNQAVPPPPPAPARETADSWRRAQADLRPKLAEALSQGALDNDRARTVLSRLAALAAAGDFDAAVAGARGLMDRAEKGAARKRWERVSAKIAPMYEQARRDGGQVFQLIEKLWLRAQRAAAGNDHAQALKVASALLRQLAQSPAAPPIVEGLSETARAPVDARSLYLAARDDIDRVLALNPATPEAERLQHRLEFLKSRLAPILQRGFDATNSGAAEPRAERLDARVEAERIMGEINAVVAALDAETDNMDVAERQRRDFIADLSTQETALARGRRIYDIGGRFKADVDAFAAAEKAMNRSLASKDYTGARRQLQELKAACAKLLAREPDFLAASQGEDEAVRAYNEYRDWRKWMRALPASTAAVKAIVDDCDARAAGIEEKRAAHDWIPLRAACDAALVVLRPLRGLYQAAYAEGRRRDALRGRVDALAGARARMEAVQPVSEPFRAFVAEAARLDAAFRTAAYQTCDLDVAEAAVGDLEALMAGLDPALQENRQAGPRRDFAEAELAGFDLGTLSLQTFVPMTDAGAAAQDAYRRAHDEAERAAATGAADAAARLQALRVAAGALSAAIPADAAARDATRQRWTTAQLRALMDLGIARGLAQTCQPVFDADMADLERRLADANTAAGKGAFLDAAVLAEAIPGLIQAMQARQGAAQAASAQARLNFEAAYSDAFVTRVIQIRVGLVNDVGDDVPTLLARLDAQVADIRAAELAQAWTRGEAKVADAVRTLDALDAIQAANAQRAVDKAWVTAEWGRRQADFDGVGAFHACTPALAERISLCNAHRKDYDAAFAANDWAGARRALEGLGPAVDRLHQLRDEHAAASGAHTAMLTRWRRVAARVTRALGLRPVFPELKPLQAAVETANDRFLSAYNAFDAAAADALVDPLEQAADAALAVADRPTQQVRDTVDAFGQPVRQVIPSTLIADLQRAADVAQAAARAEIDAATPQALLARPNHEKLKLLEELRGHSGRLTDQDKALQNKLYASLVDDPEYVELEARRSAELIAVISGDRELTEARRGWAGLPVDRRLALLMRTLAAECRIYEISTPELSTFADPLSGASGHYSSAERAIHLNTAPGSTFDDYYEAVDTIVHENLHHYQAELEARLNEGVLVPGDAEYEQARIFAANHAAGGYVSAADGHHHHYKNQPIEAHAWKLGGDVRAALERQELRAAPPPVVSSAGRRRN